MTTANKITVVRILMIPAFVTMAIYYGQSIQRGAPLEWQRFTAIAIFLIAAVSDGLDGYVARRYNQRSSLGVILDPIADKGLLLSGIITLSISSWSEIDPDYGRFPAWFPVLVISRDAVILVGAMVHHRPGITRDRISAVCTRGAQPFVVWDTGGLAGTGESELTAQVRLTVERAIQDSDMLLFIVDAKHGLSPVDQELARMLRKSHKAVILLIYQIDTAIQENLTADFAALG